MAKQVDLNKDRQPMYPTFTNENGLSWLVSPEGIASLRLDRVADVSMYPIAKLDGNLYTVVAGTIGSMLHKMGCYLSYDDAKTLVQRIRDEVTVAVQKQQGSLFIRFPNTDEGEKCVRELAEGIGPGSIISLPNTRDSYGDYEWDVKSFNPADVQVVRQETQPITVEGLSVDEKGCFKEPVRPEEQAIVSHISIKLGEEVRCPKCGGGLFGCLSVVRHDQMSRFIHCICQHKFTVTEIEEDSPSGIISDSWAVSKSSPLEDILALKKKYQEVTAKEASEIVGRIADKAVTMEDCLSILAKRKPGENPCSLIHERQFNFLHALGYVTEHGQLTELGRKKLEAKE
jgi:hypothetical protein